MNWNTLFFDENIDLFQKQNDWIHFWNHRQKVTNIWFSSHSFSIRPELSCYVEKLLFPKFWSSFSLKYTTPLFAAKNQNFVILNKCYLLTSILKDLEWLKFDFFCLKRQKRSPPLKPIEIRIWWNWKRSRKSRLFIQN